jgi:hypothetical protein
MERFSLKKSNRFAAVESLDNSVPIDRVWDAIRGNIKVSAKESLGHCEGSVINHRIMKSSKFVDQGNQVKLQWLQDRHQIDTDNLNNVRGDTNNWE